MAKPMAFVTSPYLGSRIERLDVEVFDWLRYSAIDTATIAKIPSFLSRIRYNRDSMIDPTRKKVAKIVDHSLSHSSMGRPEKLES